MVRYSVLHGNEQLFASKYRLVLPSEEVLRAELDREREHFELSRKLLGDAQERGGSSTKLTRAPRPSAGEGQDEERQ